MRLQVQRKVQLRQNVKKIVNEQFPAPESKEENFMQVAFPISFSISPNPAFPWSASQ